MVHIAKKAEVNELRAFNPTGLTAPFVVLAILVLHYLGSVIVLFLPYLPGLKYLL